MTAGATTGAIDFTLELGGAITGTVTDAATGAAVSATVQIYNAAGVNIRNVGTNAGTYTVAGLAPGNHFVLVSATNYTSELYNDISCASGCTPTSGTPVNVQLGFTASGSPLPSSDTLTRMT